MNAVVHPAGNPPSPRSEAVKNALTILALAVAASLSDARGEPLRVDTFADIAFWAGSGAQRSALVLEFPATIASGTPGQSVEPASIAWGFRWNDPPTVADPPATMADMLFALAGTIRQGTTSSTVPGGDARLAIDVTNYGGTLGWAINEISYDQRGLGAGWSDVVRTIGTDFLRWDYYPAQYSLASASGTWTGGNFNLNGVGISSLSLADGGWYGVLEADGSAATIAFSQPVAAVPEPALSGLLAVGAAAWMAGRRHRRSRPS